MAVSEYDAAMSYLERAIDDNFPVGLVATLHFYANHPAFDPIRSHPKFDDLVQRAGMPIESAK